jgi:hypothetical protein
MEQTAAQIQALQVQIDQKHDHLQGQIKELTQKVDQKETLIAASTVANEAVMLAIKEADKAVAQQFQQLKDELAATSACRPADLPIREELEAAKETYAIQFKAVDNNFSQLEAFAKAVAQQSDKIQEELASKTAKLEAVVKAMAQKNDEFREDLASKKDILAEQFLTVDHNFLQLGALAKTVAKQTEQLSELKTAYSDSERRVRLLSGEAFASGAVFGVLKSFLQEHPHSYPAQFFYGMDVIGVSPARMTVSDATDLVQWIPNKSWAEIKELALAKLKKDAARSRRSRSSS